MPALQTRHLVDFTIAPAYLSGGIYLCLLSSTIVCDEGQARLAPRIHTIAFVCSNTLALVLQTNGGAIVDAAKGGSDIQQTGINIMIAGVAFKMLSLTIFIGLCTVLA